MSLIGTSKNWWPFSPQSIPGLSLWLDAADSSTVTGTSSVTAWRDKSGNRNNFTTVAGTLTYTTTTIGKPGIFFPSGGAGMTSANNASLNGNSSRTYFFVADVPSSCRALIGTGPHTVTSPPNTFGFDSAKSIGSPTIWSPYVYGTGDQTFTPVASTTTINYAAFDSATSTIYGNYNTTSSDSTRTSTTLNTSASVWYLGNRPDAATPVNSYVCEFLEFNTFLSTSQRQQVEGYLAVKWGLQSSLPSTHPYNATSITQNYQRPLFQRTFSPVDIPGCQLWLDAADTSTVTGTSSVTAWTNKGFAEGSASTTSGTINSTSTTINGLPTVSFGTNAYMTAPSMTFTQTTRTVFLVVKIGAAGVRRNFLLKTPAGSGTIDTLAFSYFETGTSITDLQLSFNGSNLYRATPLSPTIFNTTSIICMTTLSTNAGIFVTGNKQTLIVNNQLAYGTGTTTSQTIGGFSSPDSSNPFDLGEAMIFDGNITDIQRQQVEQYLTRKWGIPTVNLPTGHPGKLLPAFSTVFTPKSISGLSLWLDGSDTNSMVFSSGTNMSQWSDKSGNGNHGLGRSGNGTSISTTGGPNYVSTTNGVTFDSNQFFITSGLTVAAQTHCLIAVHNPTITNGNGTGNTRIFSFQSTGTLVVFPYMDGTTPRGYIGNVSGAPTYNTSTLVENSVAGQKNLIIANISATSQFIYKNGAVQTSGTFSLGSATTDILSIGKEYRSTIGDAYEGYQGTIHEMLIFNTALTTSQRQQVEGYLAWKWGPQISLPDTHAFKKFRP